MIPGGACSGDPGHAKSLRFPLISLSCRRFMKMTAALLLRLCLALLPGAAASGDLADSRKILSEFPGGVLAEPRSKTGAARQTALLVKGEEGATAGIPARRTTCRALLTF